LKYSGLLFTGFKIMTIRAYPGPISILDLKNEFGASNDLASFYQSGSRVPTNTQGNPFGVLTLIPTGGSISLNNFYGATKPPVYGTYFGQQCSGINMIGTYANGTGGSYEAVIEYNSAACGYMPPYSPTGPVIYDYTISVGEGGVGEGFFRVAGSWTAAKAGQVTVNYWVAATNAKVNDLQITKVDTAGNRVILLNSATSGSNYSPSYLNYIGVVNVLPGERIEGWVYLWGAYSSDGITGGQLTING
jgi:hypothetical protein